MFPLLDGLLTQLLSREGKEAEKTVISQGMLKSNIAVVYGTKTSVKEEELW